MSKSTTVVILGANGTLGSCLTAELADSFKIIPLSSAQADVTDRGSISRILSQMQPDVIVNCAGFLNVDRCEQEPRKSWLVNYCGAVNVARAIAALPSRRPAFFQFSTDFVFDGLQGSYRETDLPHPLSHYGLHKLLADECILNENLPNAWILRVASLICFPPQKDNFLKRMLFLSGQKPLLEIVDDLKVSMTTPEILGRVVSRFIEDRPESGMYNAVCSGVTTWYDIARTAFQRLGIDYDIRPTSIADRPNAVIRPRLSDLDVTRLSAVPACRPPLWSDALRDHVDQYRERYLACRVAGADAASSRAA